MSDICGKPRNHNWNWGNCAALRLPFFWIIEVETRIKLWGTHFEISPFFVRLKQVCLMKSV